MSAVASAQVSRDTVLAWLGEVMDPEVPVVSVVDLGLIRNVEWQDESLVVTVTPTYSGCPATEVIAQWLYDWCKNRWPEVVAVRVSETPTSWAEYRP